MKSVKIIDIIRPKKTNDETLKCKGCYSRVIEVETILCTSASYPKSKKDEYCPCIKCIVKPICNYSCLDFRKYASNNFLHNAKAKRKTRSQIVRTILGTNKNEIL